MSFNFSATAILKAEYGTETDAFLMAPAFVSRTMKSPIVSLTIKQVSGYRCQVSAYYQEDFLTPGMLPSRASSRKQIRQRLKSRINPRGRPHLKQRRTMRLENFGVRRAFIFIDFFAMKVCREERLKLLAPHISDVGLWKLRA